MCNWLPVKTVCCKTTSRQNGPKSHNCLLQLATSLHSTIEWRSWDQSSNFNTNAPAELYSGTDTKWVKINWVLMIFEPVLEWRDCWCWDNASIKMIPSTTLLGKKKYFKASILHVKNVIHFKLWQSPVFCCAVVSSWSCGMSTKLFIILNSKMSLNCCLLSSFIISHDVASMPSSNISVTPHHQWPSDYWPLPRLWHQITTGNGKW